MNGTGGWCAALGKMFYYFIHWYITYDFILASHSFGCLSQLLPLASRLIKVKLHSINCQKYLLKINENQLEDISIEVKTTAWLADILTKKTLLFHPLAHMIIVNMVQYCCKKCTLYMLYFNVMVAGDCLSLA